MLESYIKLRDDYAKGSMSPGSLVLEYLKFLVLSVFAASIWNCIWWLPSVGADLWLSGLMGSTLVSLTNFVISIVLLLLVSKIIGLLKARCKRCIEGNSDLEAQTYHSIN